MATAIAPEQVRQCLDACTECGRRRWGDRPLAPIFLEPAPAPRVLPIDLVAEKLRFSLPVDLLCTVAEPPDCRVHKLGYSAHSSSCDVQRMSLAIGAVVPAARTSAGGGRRRSPLWAIGEQTVFVPGPFGEPEVRQAFVMLERPEDRALMIRERERTAMGHVKIVGSARARGLGLAAT